MPFLSLSLLAPADPGPLGPDLQRYAVVCGLLLVAIVGLGFGFRRLFASSLRARAQRRSLQVLDALPLGRGRRMLVVRCYDRVFLVGQGEKELSRIAELDPIVEEPAGRTPEPERRPEPEPAAAATFREYLERIDVPSSQPARAPRRPVLEDGRGILG